MTKAVKAPLRGDVVILDFNPQAGHEQAGTGLLLLFLRTSSTPRLDLLWLAQ